MRPDQECAWGDNHGVGSSDDALASSSRAPGAEAGAMEQTKEECGTTANTAVHCEERDSASPTARCVVYCVRRTHNVTKVRIGAEHVNTEVTTTNGHKVFTMFVHEGVPVCNARYISSRIARVLPREAKKTGERRTRHAHPTHMFVNCSGSVILATSVPCTTVATRSDQTATLGWCQQLSTPC